ncbi:Ubiquitin-conjugating enzyme E2 variant 3 [Varanus komodoensis]|nr:Ubiquitin-conjugating enzyme E2 variant 3 [Varanus komodoensis]
MKLKYFGQLMRRKDSLEKSLMLGTIDGKRRRGRQRIRWLDGVTEVVGVSLSGLRGMVEDRKAWRNVVHGVMKVEVMTYVSWKMSGFPKNRVIGIGCNLDSVRFQYIITNQLKTQTSGKNNWIIGEQGENKVTAWSASNSVTSPQGEDLANRNAQQELVNRAMEILKAKGQRSWSVGLSVADLTDSILNDKRKVHSISTMVKIFEIYKEKCTVMGYKIKYTGR